MESAADVLLWPVVATRDFVHTAWRSVARTPEQVKALGDKQYAVQGLIRTKMFWCEYQTKDERDELIQLAANCGL